MDTVTAPDVAAFVASLAADEYSRGTIRKTLQTLAMILDHAGVAPNPARDKQHVRLPREDQEEVNPPTAGHVAAGLSPAAVEAPPPPALARLVGRSRFVG